MSLQIAIAKSGQQGDGFLGKLFSGIKGAVGGFLTGGPLGAAAGAIHGIASDGGTKGSIAAANTGMVTAGGKVLMSPVSASGFGGVGGGTGGGMFLASATTVSGPGRPSGLGSSLVHHPFERLTGEAVFTDQPPPGSGYHPNRGTYYSKKLDRVIQPGEVWVRNRRRNPLNPRAASRAIRRIKAGVKATRMLNRIQFTGKR